MKIRIQGQCHFFHKVLDAGTTKDSRPNFVMELVWDVGTGQQLHDVDPKQFLSSEDSGKSSDGRRFASHLNNDVILVDLAYQHTRREQLLRQAFARPEPSWHNENAAIAELTDDWYAATFHRACLLKLEPNDARNFDAFHAAYNKLVAGHTLSIPTVSLVVQDALKLPRGMK